MIFDQHAPECLVTGTLLRQLTHIDLGEVALNGLADKCLLVLGRGGQHP